MAPSQQSVAGAIFQTVAKLCMTLGLGVATAIFNSVQASPNLSSYWTKKEQPYSAVFWYSVACSALGLCLVPFLSIGTQGGKDTSSSTSSEQASAHNAPNQEREKQAAYEVSVAPESIVVKG